MSNQITGTAVVAVSEHSGFDLSNPGKTPIASFSFLGQHSLKDGALTESWASAGYRLVGHAEVSITFLAQDTMLSSAVESLKAMKQKVIAEAERESNRIEGEIQKLLAISYSA